MASIRNSGKTRQSNQIAILRTIRQSDGISRGEIAQKLGVHPSTVTRLIERLIADGLIIEREDRARAGSKGGRRAIPLEFNYEASLIIGVDLGGSTMKGALTNLSGQVLRRVNAPITPQANQENLTQLMALIADLLNAHHVEGQYIRGIGVGAPAVTLNQEGIITWAPSLGWRNLPLKTHLEDRFNLPVFVENDVNLSTLGEHWCGSGQGASNVVGVFIGSGIGAGIIIENELYRGSTQAAGEVGYLPFSLDCFESGGGDFGCLETMAAGPGTVRRALEAVEQGTQSSLKTLIHNGHALTAQSVYQAARKADLLSQTLADETARYLSIAVSSLINILNPEVVIIGGGSAWAEDLLLDKIIAYVERVVPSKSKIVSSTLGEDAIMLGAVALVLHATDEFILLQN